MSGNSCRIKNTTIMKNIIENLLIDNWGFKILVPVSSHICEVIDIYG